MADGKKSFIAYSDWNGMFKALPDDIAGKLIKHIFAYVNDENPESDDYVIKALFEQIKATLKRDLKKWDTQREQRSQAGKKSAKLRATKSNDRSISFNEKVRNPTVSVSVSDSVISLKEKKEKNFNEYPEDKFLSNWANCRKHFLKEPTGFDKLNSMERIELKRALIDFTKEDIDLAMFGLFKQENITFKSMLLRPKHFLEKVDVYLTAEKTKEYKLYGSKVK